MYTHAYVLMYLRVHTSVDDIGDMNQKIDILLDFFVYRMHTKITLSLYIFYPISFFKVAFCLKSCPYVCFLFKSGF